MIWGSAVALMMKNEKVNSLNVRDFGKWCVSKLEPNRIYAHINLYDEPSLREELLQSGFSKIQTQAFGASERNEFVKFHLDYEYHQKYSLYFDAYK